MDKIDNIDLDDGNDVNKSSSGDDMDDDTSELGEDDSSEEEEEPKTWSVKVIESPGFMVVSFIFILGNTIILAMKK